MLSFENRLNLLESDLLQSPFGFITSSDLPFAIFRYDPYEPDEQEFKVRNEILRLATRVKDKTGKRVNLISFATIYWNAIKSSEPDALETLAEFEQERGFREAESQVHTFLTDSDYSPLPDSILSLIDDKQLYPDQDIVFLLRASVFAPTSYRVSSLLEQLIGRLRVPTILFYPGVWQGSLNFLNLHGENEPLGSYRVKIYGKDS